MRCIDNNVEFSHAGLISGYKEHVCIAFLITQAWVVYIFSYVDPVHTQYNSAGDQGISSHGNVIGLIFLDYSILSFMFLYTIAIKVHCLRD